MKKVAWTIVLSLFVVAAFGQDSVELHKNKVVQKFRHLIETHNKAKLAVDVVYPLRRRYPLPAINNEREFVRRYHQLFDDSLIRLIVQSDPHKDWSFEGWRGIMLFHGLLWLDYSGELTAINYQSPSAKQQRDKIIEMDKQRLYWPLRDFTRAVCILKTTDYLVRIDYMGGLNYRYASWKAGRKMREIPDIVIQKGKTELDGNGGNRVYTFSNGNYQYQCWIRPLRPEGTSPARLEIYRNGERILQSKAAVVENTALPGNGTSQALWYRL